MNPIVFSSALQTVSEELSTLIGAELTSLLLVPVFHPANVDRLALVACLVNKTREEERASTEDEIDPQTTMGAAFEDDDRIKVRRKLADFKNTFSPRISPLQS